MNNPTKTSNLILSTQNMEDFIADLANEVVKRIQQCSSGIHAEGKQNEEELLTVPQIADYLHLSTHHTYKLISKGELPIMRRGKRVMALKSDLFAYMKEGRKKTKAEVAEETDQYCRNKKRSR